MATDLQQKLPNKTPTLAMRPAKQVMATAIIARHTVFRTAGFICTCCRYLPKHCSERQGSIIVLCEP